MRARSSTTPEKGRLLGEPLSSGMVVSGTEVATTLGRVTRRELIAPVSAGRRGGSSVGAGPVPIKHLIADKQI
jgi:hypothetical protein